MAKLVLITDTHWGVGRDQLAFLKNARLFMDKVFFPYLEKHKAELDGIIHGGDVFHNRRRLDTLTASYSRQYFLGPLHKWLFDNNLQMHIVCGNHDSYFKDTLDVNSLEEFIYYQDYNKVGSVRDTIKIHTEYAEIPKWSMSLIPWLTKSNREDTLRKILDSSCEFAVGHLELSGFNFSKVQTAIHGDDPANFSKYSAVFSGHYHYRHSKGNIHYLGSPTEQTWIDDGTVRGFHVFDTETKEIEFIENPYNLFQTVRLGESLSSSHPRYFRVQVDQDAKQSEIDKYVEMLYKHGAYGVDIRMQRTSTANMNEDVRQEASLEEVEDTPDFIMKTVQDKQVASILIDLYNRAVSVES